MLEVVSVSQLVVDGVQTRVEINKGVVKEYTKLMADGVTFPPLVVFRGWDAHGYLVDILVDGYTRLEALKALGKELVDADITEFKQGVDLYSEAILGNIRLNSKSGYAMNNADKKNAVIILLGLFPSWSDRQLGAECGVDHKTVGKYRRETQEELHRQATGEPKPEKKQTEKGPTAKELKAYIDKMKYDMITLEERMAFVNAEKMKMGREIDLLNTEINTLRNSDNAINDKPMSKNNIKKLMQLLHEDNFPGLKETFPEGHSKLVLAMKIITAEHNAKK